ncbi:MAG TPA: class I SAM-dependent methyltransferase [Gaiellaceae bacterium]|nr:class I SAM-dependent methyltransferase [Gaiellaceae bacterium]
MTTQFPADDPLWVSWEYASEERLATRNDVYRRYGTEPTAEDAAFAAVREAAPARVLDAGCGTGEFAERIRRQLGAEVVACDTSARMVTLAAERGLEAVVADVASLPFADGSFDCAVANWVLYHVAEPRLAALELARVLRPGGRLVAATMGVGHMAELWDALGDRSTEGLSFWSENGEEVLRGAFDRVERRDAGGRLVFPTRTSIREFVAATSNRAHLADEVAALPEPFATRVAFVVFVAARAT